MADELGAADIETACLGWLNTFELGEGVECRSFRDLADGTLLIRVLNVVASDYFEVNSIMPVENDNWALRASNIRSLLRMIEGFYNEVLQLNVDVTGVNTNALAKDCDADEMVNVLELILGAAVQCEDKGTFIGAIFQLDDISQLVLKSMVERALERSASAGKDDAEMNASQDAEMSASASEELVRAQEMVRHLQDERQRLVDEQASLSSANEELQVRVDGLTLELSEVNLEKSESENSGLARAAAAEQAVAQLTLDLDEAKRDLDLRLGKIEDLEKELGATRKSVSTMKEVQARLEMENARMGDELDIAKDRAGKLQKAEAAVEKYQKRLEEMGDVKKHNKDLEGQIDEYLDKIQELENGNKSIATLNKMIEQYKDKSVTSEREKFEAMSALELKEHQLTLKQGQLDRALEAKRVSEEELRNARTEFEAMEQSRTELDAETAASRQETAAALAGLPENETVTSLLEKIRRLEVDLAAGRQRHQALMDAQGEATAGESLLREEVKNLEEVKAEREASLVETRKEVNVLRTELEALRESSALAERRAVEAARAEAELEKRKAVEAAEAASASAASDNRVEEFEAALRAKTEEVDMRENTIRMLEEKLKEKEGANNKLQQDKTKLENFAKDSLKNFKDKYLKELTKSKTEKKEWKNKCNAMEKMNLRNEQTRDREERLLLSSMYEIGVRIMDRNIQTVDGTQGTATFLQNQRASIGEK